MNVKKVMFVISNISIGGAQKVTFVICEWLKKQGIDTAIVAIGESKFNYDIQNQYKVFLLGQKSNKDFLKTILKLRSVIRREKPSVVITMGVSTCIYSIFAMIGIKIPHIISERNDPKHFFGKKSTAFISRELMKLGDGFVFQTEEAMNFYSPKVRRKSKIISNPFIADKLPLHNFDNEKKVIVTMGRLTKQKNHKMLIDAFASLLELQPDYELQIFGDGELKELMLDYITSLQLLDKVKLMGAQNDVHSQIVDAKMFVLSSDFEGMPNALIEAMAMGLPVVSTNCPCGGPAFLIHNMENGILISVGSKTELKEAMLLLITDSDVARSLGNNAKK